MGVEFILVSLHATSEIFHLMLLTASKKPDFVYFWHFSRKQNQTSTAVLLVPSQFFV